MLYRLRGELDGFRDRAATGNRDHARRVDSGRDQRIERRALFGPQRVRLAGGAGTRRPPCCESSHWQCADEILHQAREIGSERRTTGARTPRIRWVMIFSESDGCGEWGSDFMKTIHSPPSQVPPSIRHPRIGKPGSRYRAALRLHPRRSSHWEAFQFRSDPSVTPIRQRTD